MVATPSIATEFPAAPEWDLASALIPRAGIPRPLGPEFRPGRIGGPRPDDRIFPEAPAIYPWLEEAFRPGYATALVGPRSLVPRFLPFLMASVVATGNTISLREGANRFSPYAVAAMGRHLGVPAVDALGRIRLARAFTAYQLVALVEGWVDTLAAADLVPALLIASDPGALFDAPEVRPEERAALLRHVAGLLKRLAKATDRPLLVTHEGASLDLPGWAEEGPRLHETLRLSPGPKGTTFLLAERRATSVELVASPTLQHRLEEFADPSEAAGAGGEGNIVGRTVPTYRDALEDHLARWEREFGRGLPDPVDRANFQRILQGARRYVAQATMMGSGDLVERILLSVLLDLERQLHAAGPGPAPRPPDPTAAGPEAPRAPERRRGPPLDTTIAP